MIWDQRYRRLNEAEEIRATDECLTDSHLGWIADQGRCAGKRAPSPLYTSHRIYRRKRRCPVCGIILHLILRAHAKLVFVKTRVKFHFNE